MSLEAGSLSLLWKPISLLLGFIGGLLLILVNWFTNRIKGVEQKADATENKLASEYYNKQETNDMIELHIKPLVQALENQTKTIDRLCAKLDKD